MPGHGLYVSLHWFSSSFFSDKSEEERDAGPVRQGKGERRPRGSLKGRRREAKRP